MSAFVSPKYKTEEEENNDDVFLSSEDQKNICFMKWRKNNRRFVKLLRKNSLDTCMKIFQKHEIDLDVFVTLTANDLNEIGVDSGRKAEILKLGNQLRREGVKFAIPRFY